MAILTNVPNTNGTVGQVVIIDPSNGNALGTFASPMQTTTGALQTISDLTKTIVAPIVTATTTTLSTAATGVRTRVYRMRIDVAGANVVTITDAAGAEKMTFASAGFRILDFSTRPWFMSGVNAALTATTTTTAEVNITLEFTKVA